MGKKQYIRSNNNWGQIDATPAIDVLSSHPASPVIGRIYYNSTDQTVYVYNGTSWVRPGLLNSVNSTSQATPATSSSIKTAYDLAAAAIPGGTVTTSGDIIYGTGSSNVQRLGIGTNGQMLVVGSNNLPTWSTPYQILKITGVKSGSSLGIPNIPYAMKNIGLTTRIKINGENYTWYPNRWVTVSSTTEIETIGVDAFEEYTEKPGIPQLKNSGAGVADYTYRSSNGTRIIALGYDTGDILRSTDGINFSVVNTGQTDASYNRVEYLNDRWIAAGNTGTPVARLATSTDDGVTWSAQTTGMSATDSKLGNMAYGNGVYIVTGAEGVNAKYLRSTNGTSWTLYASPSLASVSSPPYPISFANGIFMMMVGSGAGTYKSTDGISWTALASPDNATPRALEYIGGAWYATLASSVRRSTNDGASWTKVLDVSSYGVCSYDGKIYASPLPSLSKAFVSDTGELDTWTAINTSFSRAGTYNPKVVGEEIILAGRLNGVITVTGKYSEILFVPVSQQSI